ncbi:MAG: ergothioneine biosynthesis protein EgtB [Cyanobacteria bacterium]|nr:ergothioneine biosynthesis protein EgtB [Cyanobacteriota bacterium]
MDLSLRQQDLRDRLIRVRQFSEQLCQPLEPEDCVVQPITDVSPPKWHLAHVTWFFEQFMLLPQGHEPFHPKYTYLFNSYYESVGDRTARPLRGFMTRPTLKEILAYRHHCDRALLKLLEKAQGSEVLDLLELGIHHEQQHQELLLTDIKYILGLNPLFPTYRTDLKGSVEHADLVPQEIDSGLQKQSHPPFNYIPIEPGLYDVGDRGDRFCFDNELGRHPVYLPGAEVADRLVTNGDYLAFIEDGGYQQFHHWLADGWDWVNRTGAIAPLYWHYLEGQWFEFTLGGLRSLNLTAPVSHICYYEADAYARWAGHRLPTEFEWEVAVRLQGKGARSRDRGQNPDNPVSDDAILSEVTSESAGFVDGDALQPMPPQPGDRQWFGQVWQWTASAYLPYPGFRQAAGAVGEYNGKFMADQWVLRGASCATARSHARLTYRNFFQSPKQWQFTGLRLARSRPA